MSNLTEQQGPVIHAMLACRLCTHNHEQYVQHEPCSRVSWHSSTHRQTPLHASLPDIFSALHHVPSYAGTLPFGLRPGLRRGALAPPAGRAPMQGSAAACGTAAGNASAGTGSSSTQASCAHRMTPMACAHSFTYMCLICAWGW